MEWVWPDLENILSNFMGAEKLVESKAARLSNARHAELWPAAVLLGS